MEVISADTLEGVFWHYGLVRWHGALRYDGVIRLQWVQFARKIVVVGVIPGHGVTL